MHARAGWASRFMFVGAFVVGWALLAACGGPRSPGVASVGPTTTKPAAHTGPVTGPQQAVLFSQCMRRHGVVNFPMPVEDSPGHFNIEVSPAVAGSPQFKSAQAHCQDLLPNKGQGPKITPTDEADYLKGVACMRSHGFPQFPDPTVSQDQVHFDLPSSIDSSSSQFKKAVETCERLIPAGLPYSDNGGP